MPPAYPPVERKLFGLRVVPRTLPPWWKRGVTRECLLIGRWAIKVPSMHSWEFFLNGLLANMQEKRFSDEGWEELCPVVLYVPGGFLSVMPRARPLTATEWSAFDHRQFCTRGDHYAGCNYDIRQGRLHGQGSEPESMLVPAENKKNSYGVLGGRVVAVDYGN